MARSRHSRLAGAAFVVAATAPAFALWCASPARPQPPRATSRSGHVRRTARSVFGPVRARRSLPPGAQPVVLAPAPASAGAAIVDRLSCGLCIYGVTVAAAVVARALHHRCAKTICRAEKGLAGIDWGARYGFANERPLPSNAEELGGEIWFEVELAKPMGLRLVDGPGGPGSGVGVGEISPEGGSVNELLQEILEGEGKPKMWVQEGDELVQVNGVPCNGDQQKATDMIINGGDKPVLTFSRPKKGYVKVVFPDGSKRTCPRGTRLSVIADAVGYDCGCVCQDGRCGKCWHRDVNTGEVYCLPLNVPGIVPSVWREAGQGGMDPSKGQYECWIPLQLVPAPEAFEEEVKKDAEIKAKNAKIRGKRE